MPAMDFKSAGARVRSLIASRKPQEQSRSALTRDVLRDNIIDEGIRDSPRFQALERQRPEVEYEREHEDGAKTTEKFQWNEFGEAVRDVARAAYGWGEPDVLPREQMRPSHLFNREMVSETLLSDEFADSRPYTRENAPESLFGAQRYAETLIERAPEIAEHIARAEQMREQEEQIDEAQDMIDQLRQRANDQAQGEAGFDPDLIEQMKAELAKRQGAQGKLGQLLSDHQQSGATGAARKVARAAAGSYGEGVKDAAAVGSLPGMEPGSAHNRTPGQQLALAEKLMALRSLMKMARMVGRMRFDMRAKRQARSRNVKVEPVGITTGQDLQCLLPHEYARMGVPQLRGLWLNDWANHSLLQWQMGGKAPADKGPVIWVQDGSGSMEGVRFEWASATGLATLGIVHAEKRDFAGVEFGSSSEVQSWFFPAREDPDPDTVIDFATHFFGGGTSIHAGLREAKRIIDEVPAFKAADIVICSDGQDYFREPDRALVAELKAMGVRLHGISVECPDNRYLAQACEYTVDLDALVLDGSNAATDALAENIT